MSTFDKFELDFNDSDNFVVGTNGVGKSNLIKILNKVLYNDGYCNIFDHEGSNKKPYEINVLIGLNENNTFKQILCHLLVINIMIKKVATNSTSHTTSNINSFEQQHTNMYSHVYEHMLNNVDTLKLQIVNDMKRSNETIYIALNNKDNYVTFDCFYIRFFDIDQLKYINLPYNFKELWCKSFISNICPTLNIPIHTYEFINNNMIKSDICSEIDIIKFIKESFKDYIIFDKKKASRKNGTIYIFFNEAKKSYPNIIRNIKNDFNSITGKKFRTIITNANNGIDKLKPKLKLKLKHMIRIDQTNDLSSPGKCNQYNCSRGEKELINILYLLHKSQHIFTNLRRTNNKFKFTEYDSISKNSLQTY